MPTGVYIRRTCPQESKEKTKGLRAPSLAV
jgi:hypothetical protein